MTRERISHMESCLCCGTTTSSAPERNNDFEKFADRFIGLAVRAGDVAALQELASDQLSRVGVFGYQTGSVADGGSSLYKLRRMRVARKALQAAESMLEPNAHDEVRYDENGHVI